MKENKCNFNKGERIKSIDVLMTQKIIYVERWQKVSPIAFLQNWQLRLIKSWIDKNQFYTATPKNK